MGKNQSASNLPNIINYCSGNILFVSASTTLMTISSSGAIIITGVISGSNILTSSYSQNSELLDNLDSTSFVFTSSYNIDSSSFSTRTTTLEAASASLNIASGSFSTRVTTIESKYATTGSNIFTSNQTICGNLTTTGTITAQTINVQQVTSSVVYSSGSNVFGNKQSDTQQFTGSMFITGSTLTVTGGTICASDSISVRNSSATLNLLSTDCTLSTINLGNIGTVNTSQISYDHGLNRLKFRANASDVLTIFSTGVASFSSTVCAANLYLNANTGLVLFGSDGVVNPYLQGDASNNLYLGTANGYRILIPADGGCMVFRTSCSSSNPQTRLTISCTGISTFACQVCAPSFISSGTICSTGNTCFGGMSIVASCVGINTSSPGQKLSVEGSATDLENLARFNNQVNCTARIWLRNSTHSAYWGLSSTATADPLATGMCAGAMTLGFGNNYPIQFWNGSPSSVKMTILDSGNVGIGTGSPSGLGLAFVVSVAGYPDIITERTGANARRWGMTVGSDGSYLLRDYTSGNNRLTIDTNGISSFSCQVCAPQIITNPSTPPGALTVISSASTSQCFLSFFDKGTNGNCLVANMIDANGLNAAGGLAFFVYRKDGAAGMRLISNNIVADGAAGSNEAVMNLSSYSYCDSAMTIKTSNAAASHLAYEFSYNDTSLLKIHASGVTCFTGAVCAPNAVIQSSTACLVINRTNGTPAILQLGNTSNSYQIQYTCTGGQRIAFINGAPTEYASFYGTGVACFTGTICTGGHIIPTSNGTQDLGTSSLRWCTVYTSDLSLNNGIGNYTIVEGENDIFLYNNNSCKVFKFIIQEVCPEIAPAKRSI